jgi:hypothetical protein
MKMTISATANTRVNKPVWSVNLMTLLMIASVDVNPVLRLVYIPKVSQNTEIANDRVEYPLRATYETEVDTQGDGDIGHAGEREPEDGGFDGLAFSREQSDGCDRIRRPDSTSY